jgi:hypothetical protein
MRIRKSIIICLVLAFALASVSICSAADWYTNCKIEQIGTLSNGATWGKLSDASGAAAFTNKPFIMAASAMDKTGLATLLSAYAVGSNVSIYADVPESGAGTISIIVVVNDQ